MRIVRTVEEMKKGVLKVLVRKSGCFSSSDVLKSFRSSGSSSFS